MGAPGREWTRLAREQGSSKHERHTILELQVVRKQSSGVTGSMSCTHVSAVATHATNAVRVSNECGQDACEVECTGDHLERRGGRGRVGRRARREGRRRACEELCFPSVEKG